MFRQLADSSCIYVNKIMHEVDELTNIVTDVVGDPTLPRLVLCNIHVILKEGQLILLGARLGTLQSHNWLK